MVPAPAGTAERPGPMPPPAILDGPLAARAVTVYDYWTTSSSVLRALSVRTRRRTILPSAVGSREFRSRKRNSDERRGRGRRQLQAQSFPGARPEGRPTCSCFSSPPAASLRPRWRVSAAQRGAGRRRPALKLATMEDNKRTTPVGERSRCCPRRQRNRKTPTLPLCTESDVGAAGRRQSGPWRQMDRELPPAQPAFASPDEFPKDGLRRGKAAVAAPSSYPGAETAGQARCCVRTALDIGFGPGTAASPTAMEEAGDDSSPAFRHWRSGCAAMEKVMSRPAHAGNRQREVTSAPRAPARRLAQWHLVAPAQRARGMRAAACEAACRRAGRAAGGGSPAGEPLSPNGAVRDAENSSPRIAAIRAAGV